MRRRGAVTDERGFWASLSIRQLQPRQTLFREYVPYRPKSLGLVKCADLEMRFSGPALALAGCSRAQPREVSPIALGVDAEIAAPIAR